MSSVKKEKEISMKKLFIILMVLIAATFTSCSTNQGEVTTEYKKITSLQAKEMMDQNADILILDVRSQEEFDTGHIKNALLIPDNEITEKAESILGDKSATILVYCRSGRRSELAANALVELGYSNVYDFGGINDWTYDIVK